MFPETDTLLLTGACCERIVSNGRRVRVRCQTPRRGAAAVELSLILPLILLLACACADFGRVIHAYLAVSNAARSGAEYGGMHGFTQFTRASWEAQIRLAIQEELQGLPAFDPQRLESELTTVTDADGLFRVRVAVTYPFETVVSWPGVPSQVVLRRQVEMRQVR